MFLSFQTTLKGTKLHMLTVKEHIRTPYKRFLGHPNT